MDDNNDVRAPVTLIMSDGEKLDGVMVLPIGGMVERTINNEAKFVMFSDDDGDRYISKTYIVEVRPRK